VLRDDDLLGGRQLQVAREVILHLRQSDAPWPGRRLPRARLLLALS
jgi:hypothetical protein